MQNLQKNMSHYDFELIPCKSHEEAVEGSSIITVCTAARKHDCTDNGSKKECISTV